jgi:hypothetical protein
MSTNKELQNELDAMANVGNIVKEVDDNAMKSVQQVLKERLEQGVVVFVYRKVDGGLRAAYGTTKATIIPTMPNAKVEKLKQAFKATMATLNEAVGNENKVDEVAIIALNRTLQDDFTPKPAKEAKPKAENLITYYDLESADWRSFRAEGLVKIIPAISISDVK